MILVWRHFLICILTLLAVASAQAQSGIVDIGEATAQAPLRGRLELLEDAAATLTPFAALSRPGWVSAAPDIIGSRVTSSALWFRLKLVNHGFTPSTRWLVVGSSRVEHITVYQLAASTRHIEAAWHSGTAYPLHEQPILSKDGVFPVQLAPGQESIVLIRVRGRATLHPGISLWEPLAYREHEYAFDLSHLIPVSALLAITLYLMAHSLARKNYAFLLLAAWMLLSASYDFAFQGYLYRYLLPDGGDFVTRAPAIFGHLNFMASTTFMYVFLELHRLKFWRLFYLAVLATGAWLSAMVAWGDLTATLRLSYNILTAFYLAWPLSMWAAYRQRLPNIGLFIVPLAVYCAGILLRLLTLNNVVSDFSPGDADISSLLMLGNAVILTYALFRRHWTAARDESATQAALVQAREREHVRLEQAVAVRTRALQEAVITAKEANLARNEFLTRVSHDLRTPLTAIIGYAGLIAGSGRQDAEKGRIILRSAQHLLSLLDDLIDYGRGGVQPHALKIEPTYTAALLESIARDAEALARQHGNRFSFRVTSELPAVVEVDTKRLRQVLENLLSNAAKFTHEGQIDFVVKVFTPAAADRPVRFVFTVRDTGPGISRQELTHIFEPFRRLKGSEHHEGLGLGLGLAIAYQWVQRMGGQITASSVPGKGTTMRVDIPLRPVHENTLPRHRQVLEEHSLPDIDGSGRILWLVEDSEAIRSLLYADLAELGFDVVPFVNGREALEAMRRPQARRPDLLLTDLQMPDVDGLGVLQAARAAWPAVPVVLLTAAVGPLANSGGWFSYVLTKPISRALLRHTVARLLNLSVNIAAEEDPATEARERPLQLHLSRAMEMIRMGAVSDLADWSTALARTHPHWSAFLLQLKALADRNDLAGCEQLVIGSGLPEMDRKADTASA